MQLQNLVGAHVGLHLGWMKIGSEGGRGLVLRGERVEYIYIPLQIVDIVVDAGTSQDMLL